MSLADHQADQPGSQSRVGLSSIYRAMTLMCSGVVLVAQLCPTLCNPMDYSQPGFTVHGIL